MKISTQGLNTAAKVIHLVDCIFDLFFPPSQTRQPGVLSPQFPKIESNLKQLFCREGATYAAGLIFDLGGTDAFGGDDTGGVARKGHGRDEATASRVIKRYCP